MPSPSRSAPGAARRSPLAEVLVVFCCVTALAAVLWQVGRFVPWIRDNLQLVIAVAFIFVPSELIHRRHEDWAVYGLTWGPVGRGLGLFFFVSALIFPLFASGLVVYYSSVCRLVGLRPQPMWLPEIYRWMCPRFRIHGGGLHSALGWRTVRAWIEQVIVVALPEEYFFRGYVHSKLEQVWIPRRRFLGGGVGAALLASSSLFALGHVLVDFDPLRLAVFFPALIFGWLRSASGSILAGVLFHASCNVVSRVLHAIFFP